MNDAIGKGLRYITDQDARPKGGAHVLAHLWDNGKNVSEELNEMLKIRSAAIDNFSIDNIRTGEPNTVLEDVFVPLYFFHRYQTEAVAKVVGGLEYNYAVKGDGQPTMSIVDKKMQQQALTSILKTLDANQIAIPKEKLPLFPPRAFGYRKTRESLKGKTGVSFDALSAPETAADMTLGLLLHPERASRLIQQKALMPNNLSLSDVLDEVVAATITKRHKDSYVSEVQQNINFRVLYHMMNLAAHNKVHPQVNAIANLELKELKGQLMAKSGAIAPEMVRRIDKFLKAPEKFEIIPVSIIPDGSPIGMDCMN